MTNRLFFYGTLMAGFDRRRQAGVEDQLTYLGRGAIGAALFDLGPYPAAVPAAEGQVWGEAYELADSTVLAILDDIEGYTPEQPDRSDYRRHRTDVALPDGTTAIAWVYFYYGPLDNAPRIQSGDYREHLREG